MPEQALKLLRLRAMVKKILIIDEHRFGRVCAAILEVAGYQAETIANVSELPALRDLNDFGLIITSYPYGLRVLKEMKKKRIPKIIFSDHIDGNLIAILKGIDNSFCMVKPLDYGKFRRLVREAMSGNLNVRMGYDIV
jgi:DNA-binding NtrC family response regulator